jgi:hypothetical protein
VLRHRSFNDGAAEAVVETPRINIRFNHSEMQGDARLGHVNPSSRMLEELSSNTVTLQRWFDMEIIEEGTPRRMGVQKHARKPCEGALRHSFEHAAPVWIGRAHPRGPEPPAFFEDRPIEELIGQKAAICGPPALGVQRRDVLCVIRRGRKNCVLGY